MRQTDQLKPKELNTYLEKKPFYTLKITFQLWF